MQDLRRGYNAIQYHIPSPLLERKRKKKEKKTNRIKIMKKKSKKKIGRKNERKKQIRKIRKKKKDKERKKKRKKRERVQTTTNPTPKIHTRYQWLRTHNTGYVHMKKKKTYTQIGRYTRHIVEPAHHQASRNVHECLLCIPTVELMCVCVRIIQYC